MNKFEVNNEWFETDDETIALLRQYKDSLEVFSCIMHLGIKTGKIYQIPVK